MDRLRQTRERRLHYAMEAARRWKETQPGRSNAQEQLAKKGPLGAELPRRAENFRRREAMRAVVLAAEARPRLPGLERMIGATFDIRDTPSGDAAQRAGTAVARLIDPPDPGLIPTGFGTGFLVSPRLLMTNHHVFPDRSSARAVAHFGFEHDVKGLRAGTMFALDPDLFFLNDEALDFALVAVSPRSFDGASLQQFGCLPLIAATGKILLGQPVSIIQYPLGEAKKWAETENRLLFLSDDMPYLQYETDTLPGSSGAPVYNSFWEVVALHHSGVPRVESGRIKTRAGADWNEATMSDEDIHWIANEGVRVSSLVEFLRRQKPDAAAARELLDDLLAGTADPLETKAVAAAQQGGMPMSNALLGSGGAVNIVVNGTANFHMAAAPALAAPPPVAVTPVVVSVEEKKLRFDPNYANRPGYDPKFLAGFDIPLPTVSRARSGELLPGPDGKPLTLKYHHMSIAMNQRRRLMMWSAANVDYSSAKRRGDRDAFGEDTWKPDPRVAPMFQLENAEFYAPAKKFDRGHIVRREDNAWGDTALLEEFANSDTFHWTNCTPQHEGFNQSSKQGLWGKLENHITEQSAEVTGRRLCLFAGPVLADDDLEHDFGGGLVKIPIRFWKVIAVAQKAAAGGALRLAVFGFVLEQASTIRKRGLEAFRVGEFATFQRSLDDIGEISGVRFANILRQADTLRSQTRTRPLESLADIDVLASAAGASQK